MNHIEIVGIPGSGKSTLLMPLRRDIKHNGQRTITMDDMIISELFATPPMSISKYIFPYQISRKLARLYHHHLKKDGFYYNKFIYDNPEYVSLVMELLSNHTQEEQRLLFSSLFTFLWRYRLVENKIDRDEILVIDEGFCKLARSLSINKNSITSVDKIISLLDESPLPNTVVILKVDPRVALDRLLSRSDGPPTRMAGLSERKMFQQVCKHRRVLHIIEEYLRDTDINVQIVNNNGSLGSTINDIKSLDIN